MKAATRRCQRQECPVRFAIDPVHPDERYCSEGCSRADEAEIAPVARASRRPVARIHIRGFVVHTLAEVQR